MVPSPQRDDRHAADSDRARLAAGAGLLSVALSQPAFSALAQHPTFLAAHGAGAGTVLALAALIGLVLPLLLAAPFVRRAPWLPLVVGGAALALPISTRIGVGELVGGRVQVALALALGAALAWAHRRSEAVRTFLGFLALGLIGFPLFFLASETIRPFWAPSAAVEAESWIAPEEMPDVAIVWILLDELPAGVLLTPEGDIDEAHFPSFARLAARSHVFRSAYSVAITTDPSVPSMLSGQWPSAGPPPPILASYPRNLFSLFHGAAELRLRGDEAMAPGAARGARERRGSDGSEGGGLAGVLSDLSLVYLHWLSPPDLAKLLPGLQGDWTGLWRRGAGVQIGSESDTTGGETYVEVEEFRDFVDELGRVEPPVLHYIHPHLPHTPWVLLPSTQSYNDRWTLPGFDWLQPDDIWPESRWPLAQAHQRLMLQTAAVDRLLGETLDRLDELGLWQRSLVVVTADHGLSLAPNTWRRKAAPEHLAASVLHVPLILKLPGQDAGEIHEHYVETVDILPTLVAELGLDVSWRFDGRSLFDAERPVADRALSTVFGIDLPSTSAEADAWLTAARQTHQRVKQAALGGADDWWHIGPRRQVIGRPVSELLSEQDSNAAQGRFVLERPVLFDQVDPGAAVLPTWIQAQLDGADAEVVAVAVNGVVRATTIPWRDDPYREPASALSSNSSSEGSSDSEPWRISAMVPPESFVAGANRVEGFVVTEDLRLVPLDSSDPRAVWRQLRQASTPLLDASAADLFERGALRLPELLETSVADGSLLVRSRSAMPVVELDLPTAGLERLVIWVDVTAPSRTQVRLVPEVEGKPGFSPRLGQFLDLVPGRQTVVASFELPESSTGRWYLQLGRATGGYGLNGFEVHDAGAASSFAPEPSRLNPVDS